MTLSPNKVSFWGIWGLELKHNSERDTIHPKTVPCFLLSYLICRPQSKMKRWGPGGDRELQSVSSGRPMRGCNLWGGNHWERTQSLDCGKTIGPHSVPMEHAVVLPLRGDSSLVLSLENTGCPLPGPGPPGPQPQCNPVARAGRAQKHGWGGWKPPQFGEEYGALSQQVQSSVLRPQILRPAPRSSAGTGRAPL